MKVTFLHVALAASAAANLATSGMLAWFLFSQPEVRTVGRVVNVLRVEGGLAGEAIRVRVIDGTTKISGTVATTVQEPITLKQPIEVQQSGPFGVHILNDAVSVEGTARRGAPVRVQVAP